MSLVSKNLEDEVESVSCKDVNLELARDTKLSNPTDEETLCQLLFVSIVFVRLQIAVFLPSLELETLVPALD